LWLADDPVLIGPVSDAQFPANREINRESFKFGPVAPIRARILVAISALCSKIPYESEQGFFLTYQGRNREYQGNNARGDERGSMVRKRGRMKPVRKSRKSKQESYDEAAEPLQGCYYRRADGNEVFVPLKTGYPGPGERIDDETAVIALRHCRGDIVARHLRETQCISLHLRCILADMLEAPVNSPEEYRLKFVRPSSGSPKGSTRAARARAQSRQEHIGRYALESGRHGSKKAQEEFGYSASCVDKAKRSAKKTKKQ
jgi:hypothetical protein